MKLRIAKNYIFDSKLFNYEKNQIHTCIHFHFC